MEADSEQKCSDKLDIHDIPVEPQKPLDSDCCGTGCVPCVFDIYEQEVKIWKAECRKVKAGTSSDQQVGPILSTTAYKQFEIYDIKQETDNTFRYYIKLPEYECLGLDIGQHIIIRGKVNGHYVTRQYTPVSDVECQGHFEILIKIYEDGLLSQYIKTWQPTTNIDIRGPFGNLNYKPNKYRRIFMLAAGTGLAPMSQVIQGVLNNEEDDTVIHMVYACRKYNEILMKKELNEWTQFWNFSMLYALSQELVENPNNKYRYGDRIYHGRITQAIIEQELKPKLSVNDNYLVLICGTRSFDKNMMNYCKNMGLPEENLYKF